MRSVAEAVAVEELGSAMVGVALDADPRFADDRAIPMELAGEIGKALSRAKFVVELDFRNDPIDALRRAEALRPDLVQPITGAIPPTDVRAALGRSGIGIAYAGIEIAHDDDPSWVLSRYTGTADLDAALFQVDVLPEYQNSWEFLRDESPEFEDEFQLEDLNQLGRTHDLVAGFNFTPRNAPEIVAALSGVGGIALTLADHATRQDLHFLRYDAALEVLRALHRFA
ncbi:hypothetical protein ACL02O_26625 [Micromonospora sp. MS34]|uniref:hypothetical protein n=1 Tax=Micromonospora sp. MS34 TaxID=3385971 RepID=UPI00399FE06E